MARISNTELERVKRDVDLVELVRSSGVELEKRGHGFVGRCPFHDDKTPSLNISVDKNLWHCMGACQMGGSVIDWVMKTKRASFIHAVELLRSGAATAPTQRPLPPVLTVTADDSRVLDDVADYYHQRLKECPEAQQYLEKRKIHNAEMFEKFKLGFADRTLGLRLPIKATVAGGEIRQRLQKLGLLKESGHEHLAGSLVIPVLDENGHVKNLYGRKITPRLRSGTPLHLYLPGAHRGVFNVGALKIHEEIVLCEALIDALTFYGHGIRNVTSAYGVEGFSNELFAALKANRVRRVLIAYDNDDAGNRAAAKLAPLLLDAGMAVCRVQFPTDMDANDVARQSTDAAEVLQELVAGAVAMGWPQVSAPVTMEVEAVGQSQKEAKASAKEKEVVEPETMAVPAPTAQPPSSAAPLPTSQPPAGIPRTAAQLPGAPAMAMEEVGDDIIFTTGSRRYRVRGLSGNTSLMTMKVCVKAGRVDAPDQVHVDTFDLNQAKLRVAFIRAASTELAVAEDILKRDVAKIYERLEVLHDERLRSALERRTKKEEVEIPPGEMAAALDFLKDARIMDRIVDDFRRCGMVGEESNALVGYLAAISRMLPHPLAVMVISSSAAGKSSLMDSVLQFVPDEHCVKYSAMTGQALYYMAQDELRQKVLAVVEEQGAERTAYALKLLQSEGELTIASTGKDPVTGRLETKPYHVEGPVALFVTTTSPNPDEELANRCVLMTVNESRAQTRAIHEMQRRRRTEDGLFASQGRAEIVKLHQNAQRLLKPLAVVNNLARVLTFLDDKTRTRRDHEKYLNLIDAIAFLRQYQRPHRTVERQGATVECVDVLQDDVELANQLASQVMGRTLDELFPQDRKLLQLLGQMVRDICARDGVQATDVRLSRRQIREWIGWTDFQVRVHLQRLVELEYVLMLRGGGHSYVYELLYDGGGDDGRKFLMGVSEPLRRVSEGLLGQSEPQVSPTCAPAEPQVRAGSNAETPRLNAEKQGNGNGTPKIALLGGLTEALASYSNDSRTLPE